MNSQEAECRGVIQGRMSLALDGMLLASEETELRAHLARCPSCQAEWQALQAVSRFLARAALVSPQVDLPLRIEERLRLQRERRRWVLGLVTSCLWLGLTLSSFVGGSTLLGWLVLQQPVLVTVGVQVLAQLLLTCQATLRGVWLLATSLPLGWLSVGVDGCLVTSLMLVCLWAWLALGRQQWRSSAVRRMSVR
jgi:anti-sigma factor RsiW